MKNRIDISPGMYRKPFSLADDDVGKFRELCKLENDSEEPSVLLKIWNSFYLFLRPPFSHNIDEFLLLKCSIFYYANKYERIYLSRESNRLTVTADTS